MLEVVSIVAETDGMERVSWSPADASTDELGPVLGVRPRQCVLFMKTPSDCPAVI